MKVLCSLLILVAGIFISESALADRGHGGHGRGGHTHLGVGLYFGTPYPYRYYPYYPYPYYPYPYYPYAYDPYAYYPPVVTVPSQPPVYIEKGDAQSAPDETDGYYWYHCDKPEGYYPYIKECPKGWQRVSPTPPPQP